jgi:ABC-type proline/glycine betaine transport system permease subunit
VQFGHFLLNAVQGEFGISLRQGAKVSQLIADRFPATLELAVIAAGMALLLGIPMGVYAALKRGTLSSQLLMTFSLLGVSLPTFLIGILLILFFAVLLGWFPMGLFAQLKDTTITDQGRQVTLSPVVIRSGTNVPGFIKRVENDTTFYKAFKNLRVLNYSSLNDVRMFDRKGKVEASLFSKTRQWASRSCRVTKVIEEKTTGDFYKAGGDYNYYTAELYASLFFSKDTVCGQSNVIKDINLTLKGKKGLDKHKEQLKMLFFNPGKDIPGIPLMGDKVKVFDNAHSDLYDFSIDIQEYKGKPAYLFVLKIKEGLAFYKKDDVVIDEMTTWFNYDSFEVMARNYKMSYNAGVYRFNVSMQVEIGKIGQYLYPKIIRYDGNWGVLIKGKERGLFTATIYDLDVNLALLE